MTDSVTTRGERLVVRAADPSVTDGVVTSITPESVGWTYSGLEVRELDDGASHTWTLVRDEAVVLPLRGSCGVHVVTSAGEVVEATLGGRSSVFSAPTDFVYVPLGSVLTVTGVGRVRLAVATARAERALPVRVIPASEVRVELRGAGSCSRQVNNYTLGTETGVDHLLVCEVVTPGGNWSSYPPHKHDEHSANERELEEIYYFEVADGPTGPGCGYHRTYGTPQRPIEVFAEVRTGDVALVPHGFHGPCMAAPGYDLYYLNVMAGRSAEWLMVDDPAFGWVRATWAEQAVDERLLTRRLPLPEARAAASGERDQRRDTREDRQLTSGEQGQ
jgi:5-deoxy-glucuronate isomerase